MQLVLRFLLDAVAVARAHPTESVKTCKDHCVTVEFTTENYKWNLGPIDGNANIADIYFAAGRRDANTTFEPILTPAGRTTAEYTVCSTYCEPTKGWNRKGFIASHGLGMTTLIYYLALLFY